MRGNSKSIIGKTISGVIAKPGPDGHDSVVMLQFSDGTCFEVVSSKIRRQLRRLARDLTPTQPEDNPLTQLTIFPMDGMANGTATIPRAVA